MHLHASKPKYISYPLFEWLYLRNLVLSTSVLLGGMYIIDASGKALWEMRNSGVKSRFFSLLSC